MPPMGGHAPPLDARAPAEVQHDGPRPTAVDRRGAAPERLSAGHQRHRNWQRGLRGALLRAAAGQNRARTPSPGPRARRPIGGPRLAASTPASRRPRRGGFLNQVDLVVEDRREASASLPSGVRAGGFGVFWGTPCTSPVLPGRRSERHSARMTENETKWSERVREWRASGQKAKAFAEGREFKASTLVYWASCLRQGRIGDARPRKRQSRVRMARVVPKSRRPDDAIVVTVGAARVTVRPGFDGALLRQVVRALGEEQ